MSPLSQDREGRKTHKEGSQENKSPRKGSKEVTLMMEEGPPPASKRTERCSTGVSVHSCSGQCAGEWTSGEDEEEEKQEKKRLRERKKTAGKGGQFTAHGGTKRRKAQAQRMD